MQLTVRDEDQLRLDRQAFQRRAKQHIEGPSRGGLSGVARACVSQRGSERAHHFRHLAPWSRKHVHLQRAMA